MNETKNAYIILLYTFPTVLDAVSFSWGKNKNKNRDLVKTTEIV